MSSQYAGSDVFPIDYTIPDDADAPTAAATNIGAEALGDRTIWLRNRGAGAVLADLAALVAITVPQNGWVRHVKGFGLYVFDSASALTVASPYVLQATDLTAGRWLSQHLNLRNLANGFPGLDATSHIQVLGTNGNFPVFTTSRSHIISLPPHEAMNTLVDAATPTAYDKTAPFTTYSPSGFAGNVFFTNGSTLFNKQGAAICFALNKHLHDGATLAQVLLNVKGAAHGALPAHFMAAGVFRCAVNASPTALDSLVTASDFIEDTQLLSTYQLAHSFVVAPDRYNVIDKTTYNYYLQFWNEIDAVNYQNGNLLTGISITQNVITDMRFQ